MTDRTPFAVVRRRGERFVTEVEGRTTRHAFSFDRHYDPDNVGLGVLLAHNDDLVAPGHGYPDHPHRDTEIVTWVLGGALRHQDSTGHGGVIVPGQVQLLSAGSGVVHAETNAAEDPRAEPVHFVQMWVRSDHTGLAPRYVQRDVDADLDENAWVALVSGLSRHADITAVRLDSAGAALHAARLRPGQSVLLPEARWLHLFVAAGGVETELLGDLDTGDDVRLSRSGGLKVTARGPAELLLWEMHERR